MFNLDFFILFLVVFFFYWFVCVIMEDPDKYLENESLRKTLKALRQRFRVDAFSDEEEDPIEYSEFERWVADLFLDPLDYVKEVGIKLTPYWIEDPQPRALYWCSLLFFLFVLGSAFRSTEFYQITEDHVRDAWDKYPRKFELKILLFFLCIFLIVIIFCLSRWLDNFFFAFSVTAMSIPIALATLLPSVFATNKDLVLSYVSLVNTIAEVAKPSEEEEDLQRVYGFEQEFSKVVDFLEPVLSCVPSITPEIALNIYYLVTIIGFLIFFFSFLSTYISNSRVGLLFGRLTTLLKQNILVNFSFIVSNEVIVLFLFFFLTLYFLEFHFFFIYAYGGSADSLIYQFNFLATSFFFVFLIKTVRGLCYENIFFLLIIFLNSNLEYNLKKLVPKTDDETTEEKYETFKKNLLGYSLKYFVRGTFTIFFFCSTFIVWLLRFCIQFIRLLVLFLIHAVFELTIVGSDHYLVGGGQSNLFFFKYIFFIFFYFCSFFYLIVYLNLMFTLQTFIFFFFSEVFQSNFLMDLSTIVLSTTKAIGRVN